MNRLAGFAMALLATLGSAFAGADKIKLAVTTSFHNSGLADMLLPEIRNDLNLEVQLLVVGTGQALRLGRSGDVDALLVHSKAAEVDFVASGYGTHRREIMFNEFVFVGPGDDPARLSEETSAEKALLAIHDTQSIFVSRGDDSGTHRKELALWEAAGLKADTFDTRWYRSAGAGMGATLNTASGMNGYVLTDRASWLNFGNKGELQQLFSGDPVLFNQYSFLPVNPDRHRHVKNDLAASLENWLTSQKGQDLIASYKIAGEAPFTPNAKHR